MAPRKKAQERLPLLIHPGDIEPELCSPGSIEQELDMCEKGSLRGDEILHSHGHNDGQEPLFVMDWRMDMAEENREGDEMTGDEHSSGLSGGETEIERQTSGLPGDRTRHEEKENRIDELEYPEEIEIPREPKTKRGY